MFCLPQDKAEKFVEALRSGRIDPAELAQMTSEQRNAFFSDVVGKEDAKAVNALFESKLLLQNQKAGLVRWAKQLSGLTQSAQRDLVSRIGRMDKVLGADDADSFLADLAEQKLGSEVTFEEAQKITQLTKKAEEERVKPTNNIAGVSDEYLQAANELRDYVDSIKPVTALSSIWKNLTIIGRNNLLLNPSTPIKTTTGQIVNSAIDMVTRRLGNLSLKGANYDLVQKANREAYATFRKTGDNITAMNTPDDIGKLGEGKNFNPSTGTNETQNRALRGTETAVRTAAKWTNKVAIDWEHSYSFVKFYQKAFFDTANVITTKIARAEGLTGDALKQRAAEIFKDAARLKPQTDLGAMVRVESQKQGARVTSINDTMLSKIALGLKNSINKALPGWGDVLMPIAKIPANIFWNGLENSGLGIPLGMKDIVQGQRLIQSADLTTRYQGMMQLQSGIQRMGRTIGVMTAAYLLAQQFAPSDFRTDKYGAHFFRIGNRWINTEYLNFLSPALAGFMEVRANGKSSDDIATRVGQYTSGATAGIRYVPGLDELNKLTTSISDSNYATGIKKYATDLFTSRGTPAFIPKLMSGRPIEQALFGASGAETVQEVRQDDAKRSRAAAAARARN